MVSYVQYQYYTALPGSSANTCPPRSAVSGSEMLDVLSRTEEKEGFVCAGFESLLYCGTMEVRYGRVG